MIELCQATNFHPFYRRRLTSSPVSPTVGNGVNTTPVGAGVGSRGNVAVTVGLGVTTGGNESTMIRVGIGVLIVGELTGNGVSTGVGGRDPPCSSRNFTIRVQKAASSSLTSRLSTFFAICRRRSCCLRLVFLCLVARRCSDESTAFAADGETASTAATTATILECNVVE